MKWRWHKKPAASTSLPIWGKWYARTPWSWRYPGVRGGRTPCSFCQSVRERLRSSLPQLVSLSWRVGTLGVRASRSSLRAVSRPVPHLKRGSKRAHQHAAGLLSAGSVHMRRLGGRLRDAVGAWRQERRARRHAGRGNFYYQTRARRHRGSRGRDYTVHVPPTYSGRSPVPLVMVLHGCHQTHHDIQHVSAFDTIADRAGFLVVYPFVTGYTGWRNKNCWGWWHESEIHAGAGEVEDLWHIIREVQAQYKVDRRRVHVTGLSAGAAMAVALMVTRAHRIASGATVAGLPYGEDAKAVGFVRANKGRFKPVAGIAQAMDREMGEKKRPVPLFVVHSHDDHTVNIQAAYHLCESWALCFGIDLQQRAERRKGATAGTRWEHALHRGHNRRTAIETLFLEGPGHGWYGGRPGRYSYPDAPPVSELIWQFFKAHPLERSMEDTQSFETTGARITI